MNTAPLHIVEVDFTIRVKTSISYPAHVAIHVTDAVTGLHTTAFAVDPITAPDVIRRSAIERISVAEAAARYPARSDLKTAALWTRVARRSRGKGQPYRNNDDVILQMMAEISLLESCRDSIKLLLGLASQAKYPGVQRKLLRAVDHLETQEKERQEKSPGRAFRFLDGFTLVP